ncbi:hypothetical protein FQN54_007564 [Arachnomyces sp. PD_36]|nr:hypothetical protein FQN54_007564 [Arachnomyces sp. PD_36]
MAPTKWEMTKAYSKKGFDKAWHTLDYLGNPVNRLSNKLGSEAFWPTTLDKESDKAARILRSFCKDGFYDQISVEEGKENGDAGNDENKVNNGSGDGEVKKKTDVPRGKQRVLKKIPSEVIKKAKGLAIFTTMRTGLWVSGSGGSGVLLARMKDTGEWSPPSGIMLHTAGLGFLIGVDIYDCVVVINTYEALEAFKKLRCTLGGEVSAVAGPVGVGGVLETEVHKRQAPIWTYLKSRGFYAGVQIDGTIIIERSDENERFYGQRIPVGDILEGKVPSPPSSLKTLMETIRAAQGDTDVDESMLPPSGEAPGDQEVQPQTKFGIPAEDDPDPYGVKALEKEGLVIREAGSQNRPSMDTFEFRPNPTSPIFGSTSSRRTSWRTSMQSTLSVNRATQTDDGGVDRVTVKTPTSPSSYSVKEASPPRDLGPISQEPDNDVIEKERNDAAVKLEGLELGDDDGFDSVEIADVHVANGRASKASSFTRPRVVTIPPRRPPPALPPRNPGRYHSPRSSDAADSLSHSEISRKSADTGSSRSEASQNGAVKEITEPKQGVEEEPSRGVEPPTGGVTVPDANPSLDPNHDTSLLLPRQDSEVSTTNPYVNNNSGVSGGLDGEEFHSLPNSPVEN